MGIYEALYYPNFEPPEEWLRCLLLFYDKVFTIVPESMDHTWSKGVNKLVEIMPDCFETMPPTSADIMIKSVNLERIAKALQLIKELEAQKYKNKTNVIFRNGTIEVEGHTFLHNRKVSEELHIILEKFGFIRPELDAIAEGHGWKDLHVVNKSVADLIVALVADRIATRCGLQTVTDQKVEFIVNSLGSYDSGTITDRSNMLASSLITMAIPKEIRYLDPVKYKEIRKAYSEIREPFHSYIDELTNLNKLDEINDRDTLVKKLNDITLDFHSTIKKFEKSKFWKKIKETIPITIGGLANIIGAISQEPIIIVIGSISVTTIEFIKLFKKEKRGNGDELKIQRLIAGLRKDILDAAIVRTLI